MTKTNYFDIIFLGGGFSASITAISILRKNPDIKICMLEKDAEFKQKIGESTSDITALFLHKFDIDEILSKHVTKTGLRFLFNERLSDNIQDVAEFASPTYDGPNNGFQFDRKILDEDLLNYAISLGAEVYRPAEIKDINHTAFNNELTIQYKAQSIDIKSKWLIDATGRARVLHKLLNWSDAEIPLETGSVFAHFTNIQPPENWALRSNPHWDKIAVGDGSFSTLHFMRDRAWWWLIRIDENTTSIGCVFQKGSPGSEKPVEWFEDQIEMDPQLRSIVNGSDHTNPIYLDQVAYMSEKLYDQGVALLGDSGAFVDPLVSPGMELICQQSIWLSELLANDISGNKFDETKWKKYERIFKRAYKDRMDIYHYGYRYIKSYELSSNWLQLGLLAFFGVYVFLAFIFPKRLKKPFKISFFARPGFHYMIWRLNRIEKKRDRQNRISKTKPHEVTYTSLYYPKGILFLTIPFRMFFKWLGRYIKLEFTELKYLFKASK